MATAFQRKFLDGIQLPGGAVVVFPVFWERVLMTRVWEEDVLEVLA